jgi:hypothetical protein
MTYLAVNSKRQQPVIPVPAPVVFASLGELQKEIGDSIGEMERRELIEYDEIKKLLEQYK